MINEQFSIKPKRTNFQIETTNLFYKLLRHQNGRKHWILLVSFLLPFTFYLLPLIVLAAPSRIQSDNYRIQLPGFNSGAGIPTSTNYIINSTIGALAAGLFESTNYKVRSGFQYIQTIIPFSFTISDISIDFGTLTVGVGSTQPATLTVKAGGAGGYSVKAIENHTLRTDALSSIDDTLCDSGPCSESQAYPWTLSATTGFGLNMQGDDIPADFTDSTYFRQFADATIPESAQPIMTKSGVTWDYPDNTWPWESTAQITFKANISAIQPAGIYRNVITFIAIPSY